MKFKNKIKHRLIYLFYRFMREDLVIRMKVNGFTWVKINSVLRVLGQKQIVKVVKHQKGERLTYAYVKPTISRLPGSSTRVITPVECSPEIINAKYQTSEK